MGEKSPECIPEVNDKLLPQNYTDVFLESPEVDLNSGEPLTKRN